MSVRIREGKLDDQDVEQIVNHRRAMFFDMGHVDADLLKSMGERFRVWLERKMKAGEYRAWFAVNEEEIVVAGSGLWLMEWPPHVTAGGKWRGNILNVYTEHGQRRQGLARKLINVALDWCEAEGVESVILHASAGGKSLYESMGFEPTNEMRLKLRKR